MTSLFDHETAAKFLSGKYVSDEEMRKFVASARWAHDDRHSLSLKLKELYDELAIREAEIKLLKSCLKESE